jgi:hypothetical protein
MRQGQSKRSRGRSRGKSSNPLSRTFESNGPDVKIRGTAGTIADRYVQLARDAQSSGDPVAAESYFQHAEHYYRLLAAAQPQFPTQGSYPGFTRADQDDIDGAEGDDDDFDGAPGDNDGPMPVGAAQPVAPYLREQPPREDDRDSPHRDGQRDQRRFDDRDGPREQRRDRPDNRYYGERPNGSNGERPDNRNDNREPRREPASEGVEAAPVGAGLPAFITGGAAGEARDDGEPRGENGARYGNGRSRRRRYGRTGRDGEPVAAGAGGPAPAGDEAPAGRDPEFTPPEGPAGE